MSRVDPSPVPCDICKHPERDHGLCGLRIQHEYTWTHGDMRRVYSPLDYLCAAVALAPLVAILVWVVYVCPMALAVLALAIVWVAALVRIAPR